MDRELTRTSKFLSYVLRHHPDALGLELEPGGWVNVEMLIKRARADGRSMSRSLIKRVMSSGQKARFSFSEDDTKIRANYGHSLEVDLDLEPIRPSDELYHGTARRTLPAIREAGLRPQSRQYVHLSPSPEEAMDVGQRHGSPVLLSIDAPALFDAGHTLYRSTDTVWLTRRVPPAYIHFPTEASP